MAVWPSDFPGHFTLRDAGPRGNVDGIDRRLTTNFAVKVKQFSRNRAPFRPAPSVATQNNPLTFPHGAHSLRLEGPHHHPPPQNAGERAVGIASKSEDTRPTLFALIDTCVPAPHPAARPSCPSAPAAGSRPPPWRRPRTGQPSQWDCRGPYRSAVPAGEASWATGCRAGCCGRRIPARHGSARWPGGLGLRKTKVRCRAPWRKCTRGTRAGWPAPPRAGWARRRSSGGVAGACWGLRSGPLSHRSSPPSAGARWAGTRRLRLRALRAPRAATRAHATARPPPRPPAS
eukprot:scaffold1621_cov111-Isochrysis_galbana.AAC.4